MTVDSSRLGGESTASARSSEYRDAWFAMRLSLLFGFLMLTAKTAAYFLTGSSAILADAAARQRAVHRERGPRKSRSTLRKLRLAELFQLPAGNDKQAKASSAG